MSKVESSSSFAGSPSLPGTPSTAFKTLNTEVDVGSSSSANGISAFSRSGSMVANGGESNPDGVLNGTGGLNAVNEVDGASGHNIVLDVEAIVAASRKRSRMKGRSAEEEDITAKIAANVATTIAADHMSVIHPDVETPFRDALDVVKRLLPYHVFQHPEEDLIPLRHPRGKGKRKATEEDLLRDEIAETKFALECWKRRAALEKRFRRARTNAGKRASADDQAYFLAQAVVEADRAETASLNAELRSARQELERAEREKRAAAAAAAAASTSSTMSTMSKTATPQRPAYYPPPQSATSTPTYASQYRGYTYSYGQGYNSQYTYTPYASASSPVASYSAAPYSSTPRTSAYSPPASIPAPTVLSSTASSTIASTTAPSTTTPVPTTTPTLPVTAIPVQLPSTSLSALSALGIVPVPAANAPPAGQPQPAAVLKGTTNNGTTVNLEINVASLQPSQMSGLAFILSALTSRGVNVDGTTTASAASSGGAVNGNGVVGANGTSAAGVGISSTSSHG